VLHYNHRLGKGGALKAAFRKSRGKAVISMDADGGYRPSEIPLFLKALERYDMAIGNRSPSRTERAPPFRRRIAGLVFNIFFRVLFGSKICDTQAGFKAFRRTAFQALLQTIRTNGFEMDAEIVARAQYLGLSLAEVPISYKYINRSNVKVIRDGLAMASSMLRLRLEIPLRRPKW
jgi:glycosyltransferase involved in cell wall biosynthesis